MIDDQVNEEEIAANRKMRETAKAAEDAHAAQDATDDGMPDAPERKTASAVRIQYRTPRHWMKNTKKWFGAGDRT